MSAVLAKDNSDLFLNLLKGLVESSASERTIADAVRLFVATQESSVEKRKQQSKGYAVRKKVSKKVSVKTFNLETGRLTTANVDFDIYESFVAEQGASSKANKAIVELGKQIQPGAASRSEELEILMLKEIAITESQ